MLRTCGILYWIRSGLTGTNVRMPVSQCTSHLLGGVRHGGEVESGGSSSAYRYECVRARFARRRRPWTVNLLITRASEYLACKKTKYNYRALCRVDIHFCVWVRTQARLSASFVTCVRVCALMFAQYWMAYGHAIACECACAQRVSVPAINFICKMRTRRMAPIGCVCRLVRPFWDVGA